MSKEVPSPAQMAKGDIIARHAKRNIGVDGVPFIFNLETRNLTWGDEQIDPEDILSLARRINGVLHPEAQSAAPATFVGARMSSLEIDHAACELKFSGVEAWLGDHFSNSEKLTQAQELLAKAKKAINAL